MKGYKQMIHTLRVLLHFIICIQLTLYPAWSFSAENSAPSESSNSTFNDNNLEAELQKAQQFNEEVVSLYDHVLGRRTQSEYYKNHPLDVYGLIGQQVYPYQYRELNDNNRDSVAFSTTESDYQRRQVQYADNYPLLEERIVTRLFGTEEASPTEDSSEEKESEKELSEEEIKTQTEAEAAKSEALKKPKKPYRKKIPIDHVFVEVVDEKTGAVRAILNTHGEKINPLVFSGAASFGWVDRSLYKNHSYISEDAGKYQFRLSYRGQVLHTFPNHISWISVFGPYVVFMQSSQVYEKGRAMPSFIDLQFFQPALGKTQLPLFRIPASIDTEEKRNSLLEPNSIFIEEAANKENKQELTLKVDRNNHPYTLNLSEMMALSRTQQMFYNVIVSLINIKDYGSDVIPFVKDIARQMEQLTDRIASSEGKDYTESIQILKEVLSARLQQRSTIGSPNDRTGAYGGWVSAQDRLNRNQEHLDSDAQNTRETLSENLDKDARFQEAVSSAAAEHAKREGMFRRLQALYWRLTMPQPLGAPKLLQGLGLIAGSLRPGKTVSSQGETLIKDLERVLPNRRQLLAEGLRQTFASGKGRAVSAAFAAGLLGIASPEVAQFYHQVFSFSAEWVKVVLVDTVIQPMKLAAVSSVPAVSDLFVGEKKWHTAEAFGVAIGVLFALFGIIHIIVNTKDFWKYSKNRKAQAHQNEVESFRRRFIEWEQRTINNFNENLMRAELKKVGLPVEIHLPDGRVLKMVFETENPWARLIDNYSRKSHVVTLTFYINNRAETITLLSSQEALESAAADQQRLELILKPSANISSRGKARTFVLQDGNFADLFKNVERLELADSIEMELSAKNRSGEFVFHNYTGAMADANFSKEDNQRVRQALIAVAEAKRNKSLLRRALKRIRSSEQEQATAIDKTTMPTQVQINSFARAVVNSFSFGNWNVTYFYLIKFWNEWFKHRTLLLVRPSVSLRAWVFNKYFDRIHRERHTATVFNGGLTSPLRAYRDRRQEKKSGAEYLSALENFERQIVAIERQYIRASAEEAQLFAMEMYMNPKIKESIKRELEIILQSGVAQESTFKEAVLKNIGLRVEDNKGNFSLNLEKGKMWNRANRQAVFLLEFFQRSLRRAAIRDLLREKLGVSDSNLSDWKIREIVRERIQKGESLEFFSEIEDLEEVRKRVRRVSDRLNLRETVVKSMGKFYKEFSKKWAAYSELRGERKLNPFKNMSMGRYEVAAQALEQPDALSRTTRAELVKVLIDKSIELVFLFVMFAAVDTGITQLVHETRFSEEAWFHGSRYVIWTLFVTNVIMDLLGGAWMKVQDDARLASQDAFGKTPEKKYVEKRLATLKWYYLEGFRRPFKNKMRENQKYSVALVVSNFKAAIPTFVLIHFLTLGRMDLELYWGMYLSLVLGLYALQRKVENTFEIGSGFALRGLIRRGGLDLAGKDKKLLTHREVIRYQLRESFKDRILFNIFGNAIMNPLGFLYNIAENVDTRWGPRGLTRVFGMGASLTEYWVELMNAAEEKGLLSRGVSNFCKKAFTRDRTDIVE